MSKIGFLAVHLTRAALRGAVGAALARALGRAGIRCIARAALRGALLGTVGGAATLLLTGWPLAAVVRTTLTELAAAKIPKAAC